MLNPPVFKTTSSIWIRRGQLPIACIALLGSLYTSDLIAAVADEEDEVVELEPFEVTGSRIRLIDSSGPSPVSVYGKEEIAQVAALTLADFLSRLPQNYSGISAGRGSTPNELNPEFGAKTETSTVPFNIQAGSFAPPANATGQSGVSLRGLGSGATLVLVDGRRAAKSSVGNQGTDSRQGYVDLNSIPLGMVERVEIITDGASALYGADAVAGVINIVLKKNWSGTELSTSFKGAFDGGGSEMNTALVHGFSAGNLRGSVSIDYYSRESLKASERDFSAQQDHTAVIKGTDTLTGEPIYGSNYLINWGYPATIESTSGFLNGIVTPNGRRTNVALTPEGFTETPTTTDDFTGVEPSGIFASPVQARRGNTSEYIDLIPPSERRGLGLRLNYSLPRNMEFYSTLLYSNSTGSSSGQPPAIASAPVTGLGRYASVVPAAYNPFGQDIAIGMIVHEFGPIIQDLTTDTLSSTLGLTGHVGDSWRWDLSLAYQQQDFERITRAFNGALITAALANPDPAQRINPFIDARVPGSPDQSALFDKMARNIRFDGHSETYTVDFSADGELFAFRGESVRMAAGFYLEDATVTNRSVTPSEAVTPVDTIDETEGQGEAVAVFAEVMIPIYGETNARSGLQRLDLQLALRYEDRREAGSATVPKIGFSWVPVDSLLFRAGYAEGFRAPGPTETMVQGRDYVTNSIIDPMRGNSLTSGVEVTRDSNPDLMPETSSSIYCGFVYEPHWLQGFEVDVSFYRTEQNDIIQVLSPQVLVNNEASFPTRVIRSVPTPDDLANGWPGQITSVDGSLLNFGNSLNESLDIMFRYDMPETAFGGFRFNLNASHTLKSIREVEPGVPAVDDVGDTFSPPKWRLSGSVYWTYKKVNANIFVNYLSGFETNDAGNFRDDQPIPSQMTVDVRCGYELSNNFIGDFGAGTRVSFGIGNLFDEKPPFADTVFGYNGSFHSPLGRTYQFSLAVSF